MIISKKYRGLEFFIHDDYYAKVNGRHKHISVQGKSVDDAIQKMHIAIDNSWSKIYGKEKT